MPDDERLGGTRDPQEPGRRHRRAAEEPPEQPRRRRRSMENSGGLSVADLVQRHTGSRANLTPVDPQQPLHQNSLMNGTQQSGRRALPDPPPRPADGQRPPRPGEPAAWPGNQPHPGAPRFPADPAAAQGRNGHSAEPHGEPAPRRGGSRRAPEPPADRYPGEAPYPGEGADPRRANRFPEDGRGIGAALGGQNEPPGRRVGETSAHHPFPNGARHGGAQEAPGRSAGPRPGEAPTHHANPGARRPDEASVQQTPPRRVGENSIHQVPPEVYADPGRGPQGEAPRRNGGRRVGEGPPPGVEQRAPGDGSGPRRTRRPAEPVPTTDDGWAVTPPPELSPRPTRRAGEGSAHLPVPGEPGQASGRYPVDPQRRQAGPPTPPPANRPVAGPPTPPPHNRPAPGEPGQRSMPARPLPGQGDLSEPRLTPAAIDAPDTPRRTTGVPPVPLPPPRRGDDDPIGMTTEMEAIGEDVQKRRTIDHTLARFSAVHDEIKAEEREKKAKRRKLMPWQADDDEMSHLDDLEAQQSMAVPIPVVEPEPEPIAYAAEDEEPPAPSTRLQEKKLRRRHKGKLAGKVFAATAAILVFVATATAWGFKAYIESSAQTVDALDPDSKAIQDAAAQRGDENFLLVGSDTRAGAAAEDGVGDESAVGGARSDTVMIAHVPKNRERVVVVSFPRDLEVTRPECQGWDPKTGDYTNEQHPAEEQVKLNTAYQIGGPMCVTKMVQELSGLAVNHFVGIDFHGFKGMVEAVQGVEVCVERPLKDEVLGTIVPEAGKNVQISGDQALNFVRARHVQGDPTSDYGRIIRQQRFLSSLLRKAMSSEVLLDPGKLTNFVDAFSKSTFGDNIGIEQLFTLGQSMQGVAAGRVTFVTVPTVGEANDRGNEELLVDGTNSLFQAIRQDSPLPGEAPANTPADQAKNQPGQQASGLKQEAGAPVDPKTIKIQVLNGGNETPGIARDTADSLAEYGFQIMRVDASPENVDKTAVIKYSKARAAQAQTLAAAVPGSQLVEDPSMSGAIMLIVGPGFDGEIVSPAGGGEAPVDLPDNLSTVNAGDVSCA